MKWPCKEFWMTNDLILPLLNINLITHPPLGTAVFSSSSKRSTEGRPGLEWTAEPLTSPEILPPFNLQLVTYKYIKQFWSHIKKFYRHLYFRWKYKINYLKKILVITFDENIVENKINSQGEIEQFINTH